MGSLQTEVGGATRAMSGIGEKKGRRREGGCGGGGLAWVAVMFAEVTFCYSDQALTSVISVISQSTPSPHCDL